MPSRTALLRLYYFVFFCALGCQNPFFPTWLRARGIEGFRMSTVTAIQPLLGIVGPVLFGVAADAFGLRGSLLRVAALGSFVPMAALAALGWSGGGVTYPVLLALMTVFAFFRTPMVPLADVTALETPGNYGRTRLFGSLGFATMVVVTGAFIDAKSPSAVPGFVAAALLLTWLVTLLLPAKTGRPKAPVLDDALGLLRSPDYLVFLLAGFLWFAAHVSYDLCFSMHLADLGATPSYVGWSWAVGVGAEVCLMGTAHHFLARARIARLMTIGLLATALRLALLGYVTSLPALFLLQPLHALTFALFWMAALEFVRQRAPSSVLATAQSLFSVATAAGSVTGMLAWGPLYAASGGTAVFGRAALVAAMGCIASLALSERAKITSAAPASAE